MRKASKILLIMIVFAILFSCLFSCASPENTPDPEPQPKEDLDPNSPAGIIASWQKTYTVGSFGIYKKDDPFVELSISNGDHIRLELFPWLAPTTVENFIRYVQEGFYDGVVFHRIIKNFMIQTGGFIEQEGAFVYKTPTHPMIYGEFMANGYYNNLAHTAGVLSMARSDPYDSASSQFFICSATSAYLNGYYAAFGRVIDEQSMDAVRRLEGVQTQTTVLYYGSRTESAKNVPTETIKITKATLVWDQASE